MKVEKLIIKDFRSHALTRVGFTNGINLIIGQNGSGKSSLLDALLIGLYWPAKPKDLKKDDFMRVGGTSTEITVFFEKDGVKYQIHRNITRGLAFVKYRDGNSWRSLESGQKSVREWVERLIPYDVFLNAIYIRQGEIDAILESDESREKVVRQVLGLDRYENAYNNLLTVRREIDARIKAIEDYLKSTENVDELIETFEKELTETLKAINDLSPQIPKLRMALEAIEKRLNELDALALEINALRLELEKKEGMVRTLEVKIEGLRKRIKETRERVKILGKKAERAEELKNKAELYVKLSSFRKMYTEERSKGEKLAESYRAHMEGIEERLAELEKLKKRAEKLEKERQKLGERLAELEGAVKEYEEVRSLIRNIEDLRKKLKLEPEEIEELSRKIEEAKKRKEEIQREIEDIKGKRGELKSRIGERNKAILELKKARGKCPVCGRPLTEDHRRELLERYLIEVGELSAEIRELEGREKALRAELVEIEGTLKMEKELIAQREILRQVGELEKRLKVYEAETLKERAEEYEKLREELGKVEGELRGIKAELKKAQTLERKKGVLIEKLKKVEEMLEKLEGELKSLGFSSVKELDAKLSELEPLYKEYLGLSGVEEDLKRELEGLKGLEKELEGLENTLEAERKEAEKLGRRLAEKERLYSIDEHENVRKRFTELKGELAKKSAQLEALEKKRDEVRVNLKKLGAEKETREEKARELEKLREARERVQRLREKVKHYKALLKEDALSEVSRIASEIFEELTEEKYSGITVKAEENKVKLGVIYDGMEYSLGFLSGGERIALGLAFRLALSLYLAGEMSLLILDEPTPYLDEERRRRLVDIMQRYLRKIPQVIVVSHDEELKDAADKVIRVTLENGVSKVNEVELGV